MVRAQRPEAPSAYHFTSRQKTRHEIKGLYCKVIILSFVCVEWGGGEALKCLIWETVNRIYANLMIPAITGGSTSQFQAAKILLELLLQSHSVGCLPIRLLHLLATPLLGSTRRTFACDNAVGLRGDPMPPPFGGRKQGEVPRCLTVLASSPAATNLSYQLHLLVELRKHKSLCLAPA